MPSPQDPSGSTFWIAPVKARQIGGRNLGASEFVWRKLFVRPVAHIEGRVPVESATKYLVDSRLSTSKELIAVAFTPSNAGDTEFARLLEFLIGKKYSGPTNYTMMNADHCSQATRVGSSVARCLVKGRHWQGPVSRSLQSSRQDPRLHRASRRRPSSTRKVARHAFGGVRFVQRPIIHHSAGH